MNTKCGNEVSQLLLHVSERKRRRRTAGKIHILASPAPLSPAKSPEASAARSSGPALSLPARGIPDLSRARRRKALEILTHINYSERNGGQQEFSEHGARRRFGRARARSRVGIPTPSIRQGLASTGSVSPAQENGVVFGDKPPKNRQKRGKTTPERRSFKYEEDRRRSGRVLVPLLGASAELRSAARRPKNPKAKRGSCPPCPPKNIKSNKFTKIENNYSNRQGGGRCLGSIGPSSAKSAAGSGRPPAGAAPGGQPARPACSPRNPC